MKDIVLKCLKNSIKIEADSRVTNYVGKDYNSIADLVVSNKCYSKTIFKVDKARLETQCKETYYDF